jgi:hypothetical protein
MNKSNFFFKNGIDGISPPKERCAKIEKPNKIIKIE